MIWASICCGKWLWTLSFIILKQTLFVKTECKVGWHGDNCSQKCLGNCRDGAPCNHVTGQCERGCDSGWTGSSCLKGNKKIFVYQIFLR